MEFWASSETYHSVDATVDALRQVIERRLNDLLSRSPLANTALLLRYVPIVMPPDLEVRYPERSKLNKINRIIDCAPRLNYSIFCDGSTASQLKEYVRGIRTAKKLMSELPLSSGDIEEFETVLVSLERQLS